jgi:hypothetical protein
MEIEFEGLKVFEDLEKDEPVKNNNWIEAYLEVRICFLELSSLLLCRID